MRVLPTFTNLKTLTVILYPRFQFQAAGKRRYSIPTSTNFQGLQKKLVTTSFHPIVNTWQYPHLTPIRTMSNVRKRESNQESTGETEALVARGKEDGTNDLESTEELKKTDAETQIKKLGTAEKLKLAVRDYGVTVVVFHVTMSIMSLGSCYVLVSSGLDIVGLLSQIGISESILESRVTQGGSTFVLAYAIHKVFAPLRLGITLTAVPFIVKKLRAIGFLKKPVQ